MSKKNGLADPSRLQPMDSDDKQMLRVVIETPKGSRNKFAFNSDEHIFELKKVLPAGMTFPYDFGFVPLTKAVEGEQGDKKKKTRNDRIVAIEKDAHSWADVKTMDDLGKQFCRELEAFFVNYHRLSGKEYRVLDIKGPNQARKLVKSGLQ